LKKDGASEGKTSYSFTLMLIIMFWGGGGNLKSKIIFILGLVWLPYI
jgi:hypothetical protein